MSRASAWLSVLLSGCYLLHYDTIDDACPERAIGQRFLDPEASPDLMIRLACHRRFLNQPAIPVRGAIQQATAAHARYLEKNGVLEPSSPNYFNGDANAIFFENPSLPHFTGADAFDRLFAAQAIDTTQSYFVWNLILPDVDQVSPDRLIDDWTFRDVVFQPIVNGAGYAEFEAADVTWAYMDIAFILPSAARIDRPIVFPRDGQVDVPLAYLPPSGDPLGAASGFVGYPVSVTVGSFESNGGVNPYGLFVEEVTFVREDDGVELPVRQALPAQYPSGEVRATVAFATERPLEAGRTYTLEAVLAWNARPNGKRVRTTFTTVGESSPDDARTPARVLRPR